VTLPATLNVPTWTGSREIRPMLPVMEMRFIRIGAERGALPRMINETILGLPFGGEVISISGTTFGQMPGLPGTVVQNTVADMLPLVLGQVGFTVSEPPPRVGMRVIILQGTIIGM